MTLDSDLAVLVVQMIARLLETRRRLIETGKRPQAIDAEIRESIQLMGPATRDHLRLEMTGEEVVRWIK